MTKLTVLLVIAGMLIGAGGCGGPLIKPNIVDSQTFNASYDKVWAATVQAFIELSTQVSVIEKDSGYIGTTPHIVDYGYFGDAELRRYVLCPDVFCAIWTHLRLNGNALVTIQDPNQTRVKITTNIAAYNRNEFGGGGKWYGAYSKGAIEQKYLTSIRGKLKVD